MLNGENGINFMPMVCKFRLYAYNFLFRCASPAVLISSNDIVANVDDSI